MKKYNPYIIIFTLLLETAFLGSMTIVIGTSKDMNNIRSFAPFADVMMLVITAFAILSISQTLMNVRKELEARLLKSHLQQMEDMVNAMHIYHRECTDHMQALQAMLNLGEIDKAREYVDSIAYSYSPLTEILNTGDPAVTSLLYGKQKVAELKGVHFDIAVKCTLDKIGIPPGELCSIIGNLLDNALEACMRKDSERRMAMEIKNEQGCYKVYVLNNGPLIANEDTQKIFDAGYTTTASAGRGFGLYQVRQIVDSWGGAIEVITQPKTTFIVTLPEGDANRDEKPGLEGRLSIGSVFTGK
ncbi:MAG: ATP-binding protein [Syntrophomonadaceae bacterium]